MPRTRTTWQPGSSSPNPRGRPRRERTITALLQKRLDKEQFVADLIEIARGVGVDPGVQLAAMRMILAYCDGLPIARAEVHSREGIQIEVTYVQQNRVEFAGATPGPIEHHPTVEALQCGGRRWGKTVLGMDHLIHPALKGKPVAWFSPTYKLVADSWRELRSRLAPVTQDKSEQEKRLELRCKQGTFKRSISVEKTNVFGT